MSEDLGKLLKAKLNQDTPEQRAAWEETKRIRAERARKEAAFWEAYWVSEEGKLLRELQERYPQFVIEKYVDEEDIFG